MYSSLNILMKKDTNISQKREKIMQIKQRNAPLSKNKSDAKNSKIQDDFFRYIVESLEDYAVCTIDTNGMITSWNSGARKLFVYREDEVLGKHASMLFTESDIENKELENEMHVSQKKGNTRDERFYVSKDGILFWASGYVFPLRGPDGELRGFTKVMRDTTDEKRATEERKESETRFQNLADTAPMYIAMADDSGNAVYFNRPWLEFTGKKLKDMLGLGWLSTLHPEDAPKFEKDFKEAFQKRISINEQYRFRRYDGKFRWMLAVGAPRFTPEGRFIGYYGTYTDFHELKKAQLALQESEDRFRVVTDNATTGLLIMDDNHQCIFMNPAAEKITGYKFNAVTQMNKPLHDIIHYKKPDGSAYPMKECPIDRALPQKNHTNGEDFFVLPDGSTYPVAFTASPIHAVGKTVGTVIELRDTTEEKKADQRRKDLERQKDEFIGIASHELKTPVTSIKAYAQVLESVFRRKGDISSADKIAKMDHQIDRLSNLIGDLLDVTKIQAGKLQFNEISFSFDDLIKDVVYELQLTSTKHRLEKNLSANVQVYGDKDRIGQVLTNLITNAIKYSPKAEKIIINSSVDKENVTICVKDFGLGISPEKKEKVFEQFYRVSGDEQITFPGLGLGLYISNEIIKRQGGRIWVESSLGEGSTFCFSLPIKKTKAT